MFGLFVPESEAARRRLRRALSLAACVGLLAGDAAAGPVVGWGLGAAVPSLTASAIAAGDAHSCAIEARSGAVVCWGLDDFGQATPPASVDGTAGSAEQIDAGFAHTCAIQSGTGAVVCWGSNYVTTFDPQFYAGQATPPPAVSGPGGTASSIAAGGYHSCAIQAGTSAVVCWGSNVFGEGKPPPSVDGAGGTASAIAVGEIHSCAIQAGTGAVVCWGDRTYGQSTPPPSVNGSAGGAAAIAAGDVHNCAIQAGTGAVVCWGYDHDGQATPPPAVNGTEGTASAITCGFGHSCAIQAETGAVVCWGRDDSGQATPPPAVNGTEGIASAIAAGAFHSLAIRQAESDSVGPVLVVPSAVRVEATGPSGAAVSFAASAEDDVDGPVPVTCDPASGSVFPLGGTLVTCAAMDAAGNRGEASFEVEVVDTTPPGLTALRDIVADATSPAGAKIAFEVAGLDLVDGDLVASCEPPSGSVFPVGASAVACSAVDAAGNRAEGTFRVYVWGADEQLAHLLAVVAQRRLGPGKSLEKKLERAQAGLARGRSEAVCHALSAFLHEAGAQSGKKVSVREVAELREAAQRIRGALGCSR